MVTEEYRYAKYTKMVSIACATTSWTSLDMGFYPYANTTGYGDNLKNRHTVYFKNTGTDGSGAAGAIVGLMFQPYACSGYTGASIAWHSGSGYSQVWTLNTAGVSGYVPIATASGTNTSFVVNPVTGQQYLIEGVAYSGYSAHLGNWELTLTVPTVGAGTRKDGIEFDHLSSPQTVNVYDYRHDVAPAALDEGYTLALKETLQIDLLDNQDIWYKGLAATETDLIIEQVG